MSEMSPNRTAEPSWKNTQWQPTLSVHVLPHQVHAKPETVGLSRRSTTKSNPDVRGWDELTPHRPASRSTSSHRFIMGASPSSQTPRSTGTVRGQRSRDGRGIHLYRGEKKEIFIITIVDRLTRCYLGFRVVWHRTQEVIQEMVDDAPKAKHYFSDAFEAYDHLWYHWGVYEISEGKRDTYSVEADNAELRHYLARLARRSRCFSRCPKALKASLKLFMYCFNRRQLYKQCFPNYPAHVFQFA